MTCMENMQHLLTSSQIQFLILVVLAGPLLASSPDPPQRDTSFTRLALNDVLFTEDVLMEVSARSRIECSKKCMETEGCVMCTFHSIPQGPPGHCRLHRQLQTVSDSDGRQPTTGAKTLVLTAPRIVCDGDYELKCGRCLMSVNKSLNYMQARDACSNTQGRLVTTKTAAEVECISIHEDLMGLDKSWLGCDDMKKAGVFRWNDGTLLPDDSPMWKYDYPKKNKVANCAYVLDQKSYIQDKNCDDSAKYICEKIVG